ncbi:MAG: hypothetical protein M3081_16925, partial [Gemmatimonadota bacterium]|nr:hypothetical protein [Gemmatimonadota bacterium]
MGASSSAPAPPPEESTAIHWARVAAVLVLALLSCEVVARVYVRVWSGQSFQSMSFYDWSPYGLVRNNPRLTSPAFHINANGFRSYRTYDREKPPRTLRVLMLGGSVLYSGLGRTFLQHEGRVTSDATMAQYLERRLQTDSALAGINIEVINGAVNFNRIVEASSGYLAEYIFWRPDVVIVCGSANNFRAYWPLADETDQHNVLQSVHPWRAEFD